MTIVEPCVHYFVFLDLRTCKKIQWRREKTAKTVNHLKCNSGYHALFCILNALHLSNHMFDSNLSLYTFILFILCPQKYSPLPIQNSAIVNYPPKEFYKINPLKGFLSSFLSKHINHHKNKFEKKDIMHETEIGRSIKSKVVSKQTLPGISLMRRCLHREPCCDRF